LKNNNVVFIASLILCGIFIIFGVFFTESLSDVTSAFLSGTIDYFGWFYVLATLLFLLFSVYLIFSRYGNMRLGEDTDRPAYSTISWLAMLFSAGMGIGLVFWSVAEPVYHYATPPLGDGSSAASAAIAMKYTFFHWGLQPWAIYTVVALSLAFFQFRKKLPSLISSVFYPLLGDKIYGPIGKTIDVLAIFATVFGVATSLGLGAMQIAGGMNSLFGVPNTLTIQILVIGIVTVLYIISAATGLDRGIKILSNVNILLATLIMTLLIIVGPTTQIFKIFTHTLGGYINDLIYMSLRLEPFTQDTWISGWTLFYWAWWIAWAPFVGAFIARISKGRTIKEFITGVLVIPTLGTFVWLSAFGGSAIDLIHNSGKVALAEKVNADVTTALFAFFDYFPLGSVLSFLAIILIVTFFVTSADSATFVLGMFSTEGNLNPSNHIKLTWGIIQAFVAVVLLLTGGLKTLQTASIGAAFPFAIIMILMCYSLLKGLHHETHGSNTHIKPETIVNDGKNTTM
jgi:glycine betaine transporter